MKIHKIELKDIDGFKIGNAEDVERATGCTVIVCEQGAVGGVSVMGGAPATRETDLLRSENTVDRVNAVVLSGGSAYGLEASSGVMRELKKRGIGFDSGVAKVPIVCAASLFDLSVGDSDAFPDIEMGKAAVNNAYEGIFDHGNNGAGTGASVGKSLGFDRAMKTGLGTFACADDHIQVGAVVAVNAVGDIYNGAGNIIAGLRSSDGEAIYGSIKALKTMVHNHESEEYIGGREAAGASFIDRNKSKDDIANAIRNAFNNKKPEEIAEKEIIQEEEIIYSEPRGTHFEYAEPEEAFENPYIADRESETELYTAEESSEIAAEAAEEESVVETADLLEEEALEEAAETVEEESVVEAADLLEEEALTESSYEEPNITDQGYDIPFNTTIGCLVTNAKMNKSQANKLASILHDAYARAIKPVHSTMDGDAIFVLSTASKEVNFDAFAALATDVLQYAVIDAATSAESAYGLPAAKDINKKL